MASALVLATILIGTISSTSAYDLYVGGRDGWVQNPKESYNNWSSRMRFLVNDKLVFKYNKDQDSVLVVKKEDYDSCNTNSPTQKLEGGDSTFQFTRSGPFYFISGISDRCAKGEKLMVAVIAPRNKKPVPPPLPPSASPPSISPVPSPPPSPSSKAPAPSTSSSPSASPANAPIPSPSSSPSASPVMTPTPSPSSSPSASPAITPTPSPSSSPSASPAITPTPSPSSSPSASPAITPTPSPSSATSHPPSSSEVSPAEGPGSGNGGAGNEPTASPPKKSSAAPALTASSVTIGLFALVLSHVTLG